MLQEVGYRPTDAEDEADIVVLNSCVVRQAAEDKVAGKLNSLIRLKRQRPEVPVVLTGCMVTNQQEKLKERFPHVDLFFNPSDFDQLQQVVPELAELDGPGQRRLPGRLDQGGAVGDGGGELNHPSLHDGAQLPHRWGERLPGGRVGSIHQQQH